MGYLIRFHLWKIILIFWHHHEKCEGWTDLWHRFHTNLTVEFLDYLFTDVKAKSDALRIHLLSAVQEAKHLKQLFLVILTDSDSRVLNLNLQLVVQDGDCDVYTPRAAREFQSVGQQVQKHLLDPLFIQDALIWPTLKGGKFPEDLVHFLGRSLVEVLNVDFDILLISWILLNINDVFNRPFHIEPTLILSKLARFQLGHSQNIFDMEQE